MSRRRVQIVLLSLGVLLGFGSAFLHFSRGHGHPGSCRDDFSPLFSS